MIYLSSLVFGFSFFFFLFFLLHRIRWKERKNAKGGRGENQEPYLRECWEDGKGEGQTKFPFLRGKRAKIGAGNIPPKSELFTKSRKIFLESSMAR